MLHFSKAFVASSIAECNIGALIIGIGFGVYYTIITIRNPQNPILIIKAPTLPRMPGGSLQVVTTERPIVASWHERVRVATRGPGDFGECRRLDTQSQ